MYTIWFPRRMAAITPINLDELLFYLDIFNKYCEYYIVYYYDFYGSDECICGDEDIKDIYNNYNYV